MVVLRLDIRLDTNNTASAKTATLTTQTETAMGVVLSGEAAGLPKPPGEGNGESVGTSALQLEFDPRSYHIDEAYWRKQHLSRVGHRVWCFNSMTKMKQQSDSNVHFIRSPRSSLLGSFYDVGG
jgi:hypothetical protein